MRITRLQGSGLREGQVMMGVGCKSVGLRGWDLEQYNNVAIGQYSKDLPIVIQLFSSQAI